MKKIPVKTDKPGPVKLLLQDHKDIRKLMKEFEEGDGRSLPRIAKETIKRLEAHNKLEESLFYPAIRKPLNDEFIVEEGLQEHHVIDLLIEELKKMKKIDVHYKAKFKVLSENTDHHFGEEEEEMFPKASKLGKEMLEVLYEEMQIKHEELARTAK